MILNKAVFGTSQREFIDKRILFTPNNDDIVYIYVTHTPDSISPLDPSYVRANALLGINRISKMDDGGCKFETITQCDCKINGWVLSCARS